MQKLTVQSEDLKSQSDQVQNGAQHVEDILARLGNEIQQLAANWAGGASDAFHDRWEEWDRGARNVQQAMQDMAQFLKHAAETYEQTEENIRSAAGR